MEHLDHDYVGRLIKRLGKMKPDAKPAWGRLASAGMIQHLADSVRYSIGRAGDLPDKSNWVSRNIVAPLILNNVVRIPKNTQVPGSIASARPDDLESFRALLNEYLALVQLGDIETKPHPYFGHLGIDGWAKLHVVHFGHHLRQFGV